MIKLLENVDLSGSTAIIPTLSVANIPQLTVDLIIYNTNVKKIAIIWSDAFIPYVGSDPFDENSSNICSSVEVYFSEEKKLVLLQIRSPTIGFAKTNAFIKELCDWLKNQSVKKVIILTSLYSHFRFDDEIQDRSEYGDFRYIPQSSQFSKNSQNPPCSLFLTDTRKRNCIENDVLGILKLGTGFATELYNDCVNLEIPSMMLLKFGSDGYNVPDAEAFLRLLNVWLKIIPDGSRFRYPYSWENLCDDNPPAELYMG